MQSGSESHDLGTKHRHVERARQTDVAGISVSAPQQRAQAAGSSQLERTTDG